MPCRTDTCPRCCEYICKCNDPNFKKTRGFDVAGALCDVLTLLEDKHPNVFYELDEKTHDWWRAHEDSEKERVKAEALAKLSARERRALGLK